MHSVSHPNNGYLLATSPQQNNLLSCVLVSNILYTGQWAGLSLLPQTLKF